MPISNTPATLLPPASTRATRRGHEAKLKLAPVNAQRIAEAEQAAVEFVALCDEVSRVHKRPRRETRPR